MRRTVTRGPEAIVAVLIGIETAFCCTRAPEDPPPTPLMLLSAVERAFEGRVIAVEDDVVPWPEEVCAGEGPFPLVTFRLNKIWKGPVAETIGVAWVGWVPPDLGWRGTLLLEEDADGMAVLRPLSRLYPAGDAPDFGTSCAEGETIADLAGTVCPGPVPLDVAFGVLAPAEDVVWGTYRFDASQTASEDGRTVASYAWNFGDGTTAEEPLVDHAFPGVGRYIVTLEATDDGGLVSSKTELLDIRFPSGDVSPWQSASVGGTEHLGREVFSEAVRAEGNGYSFIAGGGHLGGDSDRFQLLYQQVSGSAGVRARLPEYPPQGSVAAGQVALLLRDGVAKDGRMVALTVRTRNDQRMLEVIERNGSGTETRRLPDTAESGWLRLERRETEIFAEFSANGRDWRVLETFAADLPEVVLAGVGVAAFGGPNSLSLHVVIEDLQISSLSTLRFVRGDCDANGDAATVSDAIQLLNFSFFGFSPPACLAACDANGDGRTNGTVADALYMLQFAFLGGPAPMGPFPECGPGTEPDFQLGCNEPPAECL